MMDRASWPHALAERVSALVLEGWVEEMSCETGALVGTDRSRRVLAVMLTRRGKRKLVYVGPTRSLRGRPPHSLALFQWCRDREQLAERLP